jgi:hypothetical protein
VCRREKNVRGRAGGGEEGRVNVEGQVVYRKHGLHLSTEGV